MILDNVSTLAEIKDENEASAMSPILTFLLRMKQAGIACILVHHANKGGVSYRGSSKLEATFEVTLGLLKVDGMNSLDGPTFRACWTKWRGRPNPSMRDRIVKLRGGDEGRLRWQTEAIPEDEMEAILETLRSAKCRTDKALAVALGMSPATLSRRKAEMLSTGRITREEWEGYLKAWDEFPTPEEQAPANENHGASDPPPAGELRDKASF